MGTALAWLAFGLWLIACVMVMVIVVSIMILDELVGDGEDEKDRAIVDVPAGTNRVCNWDVPLALNHGGHRDMTPERNRARKYGIPDGTQD
ncbi:hypothetical protein K469DRAFT_721459 [Zopfia rhizophila CBS 207.26]|uniref:Uncharacterized protein n=1 Tax=Zopfia rhizophila CBS 207.26 TaxID=1314779 RepID=A0A6A6EIM8_9PEZI|nr:hypothetical protein K469DRAFT_721459 [Zopfia rhizophila CBS 207.26]